MKIQLLATAIFSVLMAMCVMLISGCATNHDVLLKNHERVEKALFDHDIKKVVRIYNDHYDGVTKGGIDGYILLGVGDGIMGFANKTVFDKYDGPFVPYSSEEQLQLLPVIKGLMKINFSSDCVPSICSQYSSEVEEKLARNDIVEAYSHNSMFLQYILFNNQRYNEMVDEFTEGKKFALGPYDRLNGRLGRVNFFNSFDIPEVLVYSYNRANLITKQIEALKKIGRNDDANMYSQAVCIRYFPEDNRYCDALEVNPNKLKAHLAFKEKILGPISKWEASNKCEDYRDTKAAKCFEDRSILYGNAIKALPKLGLNDYQSYLMYYQKGFNDRASSLAREPIERAQREAEERAQREAEEEEDRQVGRVVGEAIGRMLLQYAK